MDNVLRVWHGFETVVHPTSFQEQSSGQGIWSLSGPPMRALAHSSSPLPWGCWKPRALPTGAPPLMSPRETTCSTAMLFVAHDLCWLRCAYKPNSTSGGALYTTLNISVLGISSNLWEFPWRSLKGIYTRYSLTKSVGNGSNTCKPQNHMILTTCRQRRHATRFANIHPASRGVAVHTAGLFRSVRGAKGGVKYEEQSSTGELTYITAGFVNIFHFSPPWRLPKLGNFHFSPPWQLPKLWNFHFSLPWRLSKLRNFK